jgi:hypothetical protein
MTMTQVMDRTATQWNQHAIVAIRAPVMVVPLRHMVAVAEDRAVALAVAVLAMTAAMTPVPAA